MHGTRALAQFIQPPDLLSHLTLRWAQRTHEKLFCVDTFGAVVVDSGVVVLEDKGGVVDAIREYSLDLTNMPTVDSRWLQLLACEMGLLDAFRRGESIYGLFC